MELGTTPFYISLIILALTLAIQTSRRDLTLKAARTIFFVSLAAILGYLSYYTYLQYQAFNSGLLRFTLGTQEGLLWFVGYVRLHFWDQYGVALLAAFLIVLIAEYFNKKKGGIFMEPEEFYLAALGIFLVGYPGFFFYIILVLLASAVASAIFLKKGERLPLYYFWIPTAIAVLIAIQLLGQYQPWWTSFRF